ncbi:hypothetical protein CSIRO_2777 [Bradyrhizobiaceae bacterium SG-6C]|nr:hypothetical protein CSIRO_2777 [Bradyrhizobiaceae bacterium SG-6C]
MTDEIAANFGPAMLALNERQRAFVSALFEAPRKHGAAVFAARAAGYGTPTSSKQSMFSIASRLMSDQKVQEAITEESRKYITTLGPLAVRALKNLIGDPTHKEHGRALGIAIERIMPAQSTHAVKVEIDATPGMRETAVVMARIAELAARYAVALPAPRPVIEGNVDEVGDAA